MQCAAWEWPLYLVILRSRDQPMPGPFPVVQMRQGGKRPWERGWVIGYTYYFPGYLHHTHLKRNMRARPTTTEHWSQGRITDIGSTRILSSMQSSCWTLLWPEASTSIHSRVTMRFTRSWHAIIKPVQKQNAEVCKRQFPYRKNTCETHVITCGPGSYTHRKLQTKRKV